MAQREQKKCNFAENGNSVNVLNSNYRFLFYLLLFSGLGCFSFLFLVSYGDLSPESRDYLMSVNAFAVVALIFNIIGFSLVFINNRISQRVLSFLKDKERFILYLLITGIILLVFNYFLLVCIKWAIGMPDLFILKARGFWIILVVWLLELVIMGQAIANNFYRGLVLLYQKTTELEESATKAKYQALQSQLNPHFLFNSLNTLVSEIEYNPANASLFTRHLSDVYRYILQNQDQQTISLQSELSFLDSFLFLHHVRLGDCINMRNHVNPSLFDMHIPPLTLQLLVENVIKHNNISLSKPMTIDIMFSKSDMMLQVCNEIHTKKISVPSGKGLQNLSERYLLLCGRDIVIENDNRHFTVKVPLLNE